MGTRLPEPVRDELDRIATGEGVTRSALLARVIARFVEEYPARDL